MLFARRLDQITTHRVLQQPRGNLLRGDETPVLPIRLLDDAGDDREDVRVFPGRFRSCHPKPPNELASMLPAPGELTGVWGDGREGAGSVEAALNGTVEPHGIYGR